MLPTAACLLVASGVAAWRYYEHRLPVEAAGHEGLYKTVQTEHDRQTLVPLKDLVITPLGKEGIPAIHAPSLERPFVADQYLKDEGRGVSVTLQGVTRLYPYQLLTWHHVVNDNLAGTNILVVYDPLAGSANVFSRGIEVFTVSDTVWNSTGLLIDQSTQSLWNPVTGQAIVGSRAGEMLPALPSDLTLWNIWKRAYPAATVISRETGVTRDYTRDPYGTYERGAALLYPLTHRNERMRAKARVYGVHDGTTAAAWESEDLERHIVTSATVGTLPVLLVSDSDTEIVRGFDRRVQDRTLTFILDDDAGLIDAETRSGWDMEGLAVRGELKGTQLSRIVTTPAYWFAWSGSYPDTTLGTRDE